MNKLLSDNLWPTIAELSRNHRRLFAAISYVTASTHLNFAEGDVLVCDASDSAIKTGMTSAKTLRLFFRNKAKIFSIDGLHAKTFVFDGKVVIGSANLSANAGVNTCEASLLSDDQQIVSLVRGYIEQLIKRGATIVDGKFLKRIEAIPVFQTRQPRRKNLKQVKSSTFRLWLVSTVPLSEKISRKEAAVEKEGMAKATEKLQDSKSEIRTIRWHGNSSFRKQAMPGHRVIEVSREKRGKRTYIEVYSAAPVIHRQDSGKWTRFYLEVPPDENLRYRWNEFKADLKRLGFKKITPKSNRELTEQATQVLACLKK
jgi:hypothetical protein